MVDAPTKYLSRFTSVIHGRYIARRRHCKRCSSANQLVAIFWGEITPTLENRSVCHGPLQIEYVTFRSKTKRVHAARPSVRPDSIPQRLTRLPVSASIRSRLPGSAPTSHEYGSAEPPRTTWSARDVIAVSSTGQIGVGKVFKTYRMGRDDWDVDARGWGNDVSSVSVPTPFSFP